MRRVFEAVFNLLSMKVGRSFGLMRRVFEAVFNRRAEVRSPPRQ
ncbi:MAG: hypothetical protein RMM53_13290 [Bacteroidia bacterium]|nr:hypothetical protein [Bacteroidia bacterium]